MKERKNCLYPDCNRYAEGRGLCRKHYENALYHVSKGHVTWEQLEEQGKALRKSFHRSPDNWFLQVVNNE